MAERLDRHPLSTIWGDMPKGEYAELVESARQEGILDFVIKTLDDQVLDGWHRYRAAQDAGVEHQLIISPYQGGDPVSFVIRKNAHRRHLTAGQRAQMIVGCREWAKTGRPQKGEPGAPFPATVEEMADEAGVSERTIQQAKVAEEAGLGAAVRAGDLSPKAAAQQAAGGSDKPKEPTKAQRLETELEAISLEVSTLKQEKADLQMQVDWFEAQKSDYGVDHYKRVNDQQAEIRTLQGRLNRLVNEKEEARRQARYWKAETMRLGWKESRETRQPEMTT